MTMQKVLVIEDEKAVRENLTTLLTESGYTVTACENGFLGAISALDSTPDLILCDVMMPDMDGFEVLQALRKNSDTAFIPFIFLTARADNESSRNAMNLGADDYIAKPYEITDLLRVIEVNLKKRSYLENLYTVRNRQNAINKILVAIYALENIECQAIKAKSLELLRIVCDTEVELLSKTKDLENVLSPHDLEMFYRLKNAAAP